MAEKSTRASVQEAKQILAEAETAMRHAIASMADGPARGRVIQDRWAVWQMLGQAKRYFSQAGQDEFLDRVVFQRKRGGVFVEIGAYDGITGSNTLFFEAFRGWSGLLIEASPTYFERVAETRDTLCLQLAVAPEPGEVAFLDIKKGYTQMGGIVDSLGQQALAAIEADDRTDAEVIQIEAKPLADILRENALTRVDYLSIDIEGGELAVLERFPFAEFDIHAWSIEVNEETPRIGELMTAAGYVLAAHIGVDQIWVKGVDTAEEEG
ncbi:MAG: FkbM family methyltransferase [Pseudomonadota bacterium]